MNTKTTFEDRLLRELQHEIEVRGVEAGGAEARAAEMRGTELCGAELRGVGVVRRPRARGLLTGRRLALAAGACALAGLAVVLVPGSPADSPAYAVERHGDGSVTLTLVKLVIGPESQRRLAERLRAEGIDVTIDSLPFGHQCAQPRGTLLSGTVDRAFIGDKAPEDGSVPVGPTDPAFDREWQVTLHPGDSLGIENTARKDGEPGPNTERFYAIKGRMKPCEPESFG
ncbi:hypothetical protein [Streptomyces sp. S.PNR 29]|uniref:hypothetical protein n=1 Tax=Streptomyces sp. S.PNR 29 TaxID=2973805 RepID=UPI0025B1EF1E|nr:hypothetical protein [Streptomyces sp. S.PNR 29]MDN0198109.1 hypothetical protein [Streptomyces sp. S.PNR 29]